MRFHPARPGKRSGSKSQRQMTKPAADFARMKRPSRGASFIGRRDWPISSNTRSTWPGISRFPTSLKGVSENR
jgi:hypothetical protein